VRDLPPVRVGPDTYSAQVRTRPDRGLLVLTYVYRVERDGEIVREESEEFTMWPASSDVVQDELRQAGFTVEDAGAGAGTENGLVRATCRVGHEPGGSSLELPRNVT
jgi:hypothetical protein